MEGDNWQSRLQQLESAVWGKSAEDNSDDGDSSGVAIDQDPPTFVTEQPASIVIPTPSRAQVDPTDGIPADEKGEAEEMAGGAKGAVVGKDANDGRDEGQSGAGIKRIRTMKSAARTVLVGVALCPKVETLQNQARFQKYKCGLRCIRPPCLSISFFVRLYQVPGMRCCTSNVLPPMCSKVPLGVRFPLSTRVQKT